MLFLKINVFLQLFLSCRRQRGVVESLSGWVFGQRLDDLTDEELQAEILYAEANLLLSFLTFLQVSIPFHCVPVPCRYPFLHYLCFSYRMRA